jgi:hypothetical protein
VEVCRYAGDALTRRSNAGAKLNSKSRFEPHLYRVAVTVQSGEATIGYGQKSLGKSRAERTLAAVFETFDDHVKHNGDFAVIPGEVENPPVLKLMGNAAGSSDFAALCSG